MARRQKHEEHENLERWLVSYADFITLLFAFFVVMYSISQVNEGKYRVLSDSLVNAFKTTPTATTPIAPALRIDASQGSSSSAQALALKQTIFVRKPDPVIEARKKQQTEKMKGVAEDILKAMEPLVKEGQVKVTQSAHGIAIEINASVLFSSGQATLEPGSIKALRAVGGVLAKVPNDIQVEGFTDNTPISTAAFPSNWELSTARASSVVRLLAESGAPTDRLVAVGYGEFRPVDTNSTPEGRARNRRVTV
ncbi:OmpA/MotB domain-containing protein [Sulfuricella denitrificans skB26]|uniref:OmpA/MotB domain-containing protein n=1 Tax=Sulfuricella denitrificans (strain DSM 22764 / NBRC 105220 / skB26) TaxID=1163617 RepID=S6B367_SULDS|nr:flagellar motor protein MotD [Sulfuricella denitrificans]BAN35097.1 OmpA/MotB domain-containing protein [Sulfuricella denitrificans skB26]